MIYKPDHYDLWIEVTIKFNFILLNCYEKVDPITGYYFKLPVFRFGVIRPGD